MMHLSINCRALLVAGGMILALPAMLPGDDGEPRVEVPDSGEGGELPLFPLEIGTRWEYHTKVHVFPTELVRDDDGEVSLARPRLMEGSLVIELVGFEPFGGSNEPVAHFVIRVDEEVVDEEFSEVTKDLVRSYGGRSLVKATGQWRERVLDPPLQTLQADLRQGAHWFQRSVVSGDLVIGRRFDVLGEEIVSVTAGDFDATKLRLVGNDSKGAMLKRYLWYHRGMGLVRTHTVYYGKGQVTMVRSEELMKFTPGPEASGAQVSGKVRKQQNRQ